jgi:hypothetical protein
MANVAGRSTLGQAVWVGGESHLVVVVVEINERLLTVQYSVAVSWSG